MKKLIIALMICMLTFSYIYPCVVFADAMVAEVSINTYFISYAQSLGEVEFEIYGYEENGITYWNPWTEDFGKIKNISEFWGEVNYEKINYIQRRNHPLEKFVDDMISRIINAHPEYEVDTKNTTESLKMCVYRLLCGEGENIKIKWSAQLDNIISITIPAEALKSEYHIIKVDTSKTEEERFDEKLDEDGAKKTTVEGVYKYENGRYFCTANIGAEIWEKNYIYGLFQDWILLHSTNSNTYYDWELIFETWGDDVYKMRVYFDEIDENGKPKNTYVRTKTGNGTSTESGWRPGAEDIQCWIDVSDISSEEFKLPEGEDPIYYSDEYAAEYAMNLDDTDVGGILLKPIFGLVNVILDAIAAMLRNFMIPTESGIWVMEDGYNISNPETEIDEDVDCVYEYDMDSKHTITDVQYPTTTYSPEEIFAGKIDILSVDFISNESDNADEGWLSVRTVIAQWYKALRMMAIIGLLSVLIYTGIKILISSNAKDKAKYKEWIINWIMAVAILFAMHIIMAFIVSLINQISELISASARIIINNNDKYHATNLMGLVRFMIQADSFAMKIGYEVLYVMLVIFTFKFTFTYLKRVLNMAFLTLIAPIVAFTYPIDKMNDGQAQGFNMWLKEYIFNALLQPMHYIMYYILLSSAIGLAARNPIYGIVVLTFMSEAEKLLKKIFGFDKAKGGTVGGMANAFAAGTLASQIIKPLKGNTGRHEVGGSGGPEPLDEGLKGNLQGMDEFVGEDDNANEKKDENKTNNNRLDENQVARERSVLDEFEAEGALSDDWTDEDYAAFDELEKEQLAKEEQLRQQQALEQENKPEDKPEQTAEDKPEDKPENKPENEPENKPENKPIDSGKPIREMKKAKRIEGMKAVGKQMLKPIYDFDKSGKYNAKRWARRISKAVIAPGIGIAAVAVQAGISLTDGKYSLGEGVAVFSAGLAGGSRIVDGMFDGAENVRNTYLNAANAGDEQAQLERIQKKFGDRDDVIQFNKKNFAGREKEAMQRQRDNYLVAGVTDLKEMKSGMKYADKLVGNTKGLSEEAIKTKREKADRRAAATIDFKKQLESQGQLSAVYDKKKREKYIQTMVDNAGDEDKAKVRKQYENAFKSVIAFNKANE